MQKIQNKQVLNDYQKSFSSCAARENIKKCFQGMIKGVKPAEIDVG